MTNFKRYLFFVAIVFLAGCSGYQGNQEESDSINESSQGSDGFIGDFKVSDFVQTGENYSLQENTSLFSFNTQSGGSAVISTQSSAENIHSHYVGGKDLNAYSYSGSFRGDNLGSGFGVTFLSSYPESDRYYRLSSSLETPEFHLSARGSDACLGQTSTLRPEAGEWYSFRVVVVVEESRNIIQAKVWPSYVDEPFSPQLSCIDSSSGRNRKGTIGLWSSGAGQKSWANLGIQFSPFVEAMPEEEPGESEPPVGRPPEKIGIASIQGSANLDPTSNLTDGRLDTRWAAEGERQTLTINFDALYTVSYVDLAFYRGQFRDTRFDIQLRWNGGNQFAYQTIFSGSTMQRSNDLVPYLMTRQVAASGIRIIGYGNTENDWTSITELAVYGRRVRDLPPEEQTSEPMPEEPMPEEPMPEEPMPEEPMPQPTPQPTPTPVPNPVVNGWTELSMIGKTQHVVSASYGNDSNPGTMSQPYQSFLTAFKKLTHQGDQEFVLLKSGDTFTDSNISLNYDAKSGQQHVVTGYGGGVCPVIKDTKMFGGGKIHNLALIGVCLDRSDFGTVGDTENLLLEGLNINNSSIKFQGFEDYIGNVTIRRSVITDKYNVSSHAQGMFVSKVSGEFRLEDNIFDHNGWLIPQTGNNDKSGGQATMFNHNTYFEDTNNVVMRGNTFLRPSSMHNKFTANSPRSVDEITSANVVLDNNFYYDGEMAISAGGNTDRNTGARFKDYRIINNVITEMGKGRPTGRELAWGVEVKDWEGGEVRSNIITQLHPGNSWYLRVDGHNSNVDIANNIFYHGLDYTDQHDIMIRFQGVHSKNIKFRNNHIQAPRVNQKLIQIPEELVGKIQFSGNVYYSQDPKPFRIGSTSYTFEEWKARTGDTSIFVYVNYLDPDRSLASYAGQYGMTMEDVYSFIRGLSKNNWSDRFSAEKINQHFRQGFENNN